MVQLVVNMGTEGKDRGGIVVGTTIHIHIAPIASQHGTCAGQSLPVGADGRYIVAFSRYSELNRMVRHSRRIVYNLEHFTGGCFGGFGLDGPFVFPNIVICGMKLAWFAFPGGGS